MRSSNPDNAVYQVSGIHLRYKTATIAAGQSRFDDAETFLLEAVRLQTTLIEYGLKTSTTAADVLCSTAAKRNCITSGGIAVRNESLSKTQMPI